MNFFSSGYKVIHMPTLSITSANMNPIDTKHYDGLIFTSANAVRFLKLKSNDFRFCVELPIKAIKKNYRITSISSYERSRIAGRKKVNAIRDGFLILTSMIKLFFC